MPRAGLSREAVVDVAVDLVDTGSRGFAELTLASVAARAGVAVPSLYKHIGSLAELRRDVAIVGFRELNRRCSIATIGRAEDDALRALGREIRAFALERPGLYAATQLGADFSDPDQLAFIQAAGDAVDVIGAVLRGFGLPEERTVDAIRATRSAIHGFTMLEAGGGFGMPDDVDASYEALLSILVAGVRTMARAA